MVRKLTLKKVLQRKELLAVLEGVVGLESGGIAIYDPGGQVLWQAGKTGPSPGGGLSCFPVEIEEGLLGEVRGTPLESGVAASLLTLLARGEQEKRALAKETLEKYKEINLLYGTSEKLAAVFEPEEVARLITEETAKVIKGDYIQVKLCSPEREDLGLLSFAGDCEGGISTAVEGIEAGIARKGDPEIVNDLPNDSRFGRSNCPVSSLVCAPLRVKDEAMGVITVISREPYNYTAGDLKMLSALAFQAATAIENIRLFDSFLQEQDARERVTRLFGRYVASQVVDEILKIGEDNLKLGGARRQVSIMFVDIRGFTRMSEKLPPEEVVEMLNRYFYVVTRCIFEKQGTIDKFMGDAVVAVFNAPLFLPDHSFQAVEAARAIHRESQSLRDWARDRWGFDLRMGIGINTGEVIAGNIGTDNRMEYTVIGDAVNLAARLESIAGPGQILISETVSREIHGRVPYGVVGEVTLKGKEKPVKVYRVTE